MKKFRSLLVSAAVVASALLPSAQALVVPGPFPGPSPVQYWTLVGESYTQYGILRVKNCHYRSNLGGYKTTTVAAESPCPKTLFDPVVIYW